MGIVGQANVDTANTLFTGYAEQLFANVGKSGVWEALAEKREGNEINELDILEAMPVLREWLGPKRFDDVRFSSFSVKMKSYEKSFRIKRRKLEGMSIPDLSSRIQSWLGLYTAWYDNLVVSALLANGTCYDGVALFSASHPRGPAGATQSNITTSAFSVAVHKAALLAMQSLADENGESFEISPNLFIVGPKRLPDALEITQSKERIVAVDNSGAESGTRVAAATIPNVFSGPELYGGGSMTVMCSKRLIGSNAEKGFYVDTTKGARPIVLFEKRAPTPVAMVDMTSPARFYRDEYEWSLEGDMVAAPAAWQTAYFINA